MAEYAEGYEAPFMAGLWKRVTMYGIPHYWFAVWFVASVVQVVVIGIKLLKPHFGWINGIMPVLFLCGGELMLMQWVTRLDMDWDNLALWHLLKGWPRYMR